MAEYRVTCVGMAKAQGITALIPPPASTEHIAEVGLDELQVVPVAWLIRDIKANTHRFYVVGGGQKVYVEVYTRGGKDFIRTERDATKQDNLLALKKCAP